VGQPHPLQPQTYRSSLEHSEHFGTNMSNTRRLDESPAAIELLTDKEAAVLYNHHGSLFIFMEI